MALAAVGCSSSSSTGGSGSGSTSGTSGATTSGGNGSKIQVTFSGETLGVSGLPFNPSSAANADPFFVDGWGVTIDEFLISVGNVRLSPNATKNPDQSVIEAPVALKAGPWIVDIHKPHGLVGKDGVEPAQELFTWTQLDNGSPLDTSARYAFSYDTVPASATATKVNLESTQDADVALMVQHGWNKLIRGTATFAGTATYPDAAVQAKFAALPRSVPFVFGYNDSAKMLNCANPDFGDANVPANRGIQPKANGTVVAQITVHVDHVFWDKLKQEGTPLRFDPEAAWAPTDGGVLDLAALTNRPLTATFADGTPMPDRGPQESSSIGFTTDQPANGAQVVLNTNGVTTVSNLSQFLAFSNQAQTHLNANGLCYITGQQASDPYYAPQFP